MELNKLCNYAGEREREGEREYDTRLLHFFGHIVQWQGDNIEKHINQNTYHSMYLHTNQWQWLENSFTEIISNDFSEFSAMIWPIFSC